MKKKKRMKKYKRSTGRCFGSIHLDTEEEYAEMMVAVGMKMHFEEFINPEIESFEEMIEKVRCGLCDDYLSGECPGKELSGLAVVDCIALQMGFVRKDDWSFVSEVQ